MDDRVKKDFICRTITENHFIEALKNKSKTKDNQEY